MCTKVLRFVKNHYYSVSFFSSSTRNLKTLAFVESVNGKITPSSLSSITAAQALGKPVTAILAGSDIDTAISSARKTRGISHVLFTKNERFNHNLAEDLAPLMKAVLEKGGYSHVITTASAVGKSLLPRLGALIDVQPISEVIKVVSSDTFIRPIYAGNALATIQSQEKITLVSVRSSAYPPSESDTNEAPVEELTSSSESRRLTEFIREDLVTSERPELGSASRVVTGGRGLKNKETFESLMEPLASALNAAIGASRAAVDAGFCDNSLQVGQTGKIVAPELYIAIGVSGAIQHLAGMKDSKHIVAINKDPEAPIFNVADIGLVSDLIEAVPELTSKL